MPKPLPNQKEHKTELLEKGSVDSKKKWKLVEGVG